MSQARRWVGSGSLVLILVSLTGCSEVYTYGMIYFAVAPLFLLGAWGGMHLLAKQWNRDSLRFVSQSKPQWVGIVLAYLWFTGAVVSIYLDPFSFYTERNLPFSEVMGEFFPDNPFVWLKAIEFFVALFAGGALLATRMGILFRWRYTFVAAPLISTGVLSIVTTWALLSSPSAWIHAFAIHVFGQLKDPLGAWYHFTPWGWVYRIAVVALWLITWFEPTFRRTSSPKR